MDEHTNSPDSRHVRWAARVRPDLIRRLYELDAQGIVDDGLIDEVGVALLARCEAIRRVSLRLCPHCGGAMLGERTAESIITCAGCGWAVRWRRYQNSYKKQRVNGPRALPAFEAFMAAFPLARTWTQKMLAIDRLIHAVHESLRPDQNPMVVPAAENLIEGSAPDTLALLEHLAGEPCPAGRDARGAWLTKVQTYKKRLEREARRRRPSPG